MAEGLFFSRGPCSYVITLVPPQLSFRGRRGQTYLSPWFSSPIACPGPTTHLIPVSKLSLETSDDWPR